MNEDVRYRASTQYRLWSFTVEALASQRAAANRIAVDRINAARSLNSNGSDKSTDNVACLTPAEELKLLVFYSKQAIALGDHLKLPTDVRATAIQYLKRFYTTNSIMTYHPRNILKTALFFSTKTENHYFKLSKFCEQIGKTKEDDILQTEFLLTQGLRFTFDVRHPSRALEGAVMEIQALSGEDGQSIPALPNMVALSLDRPPDISNRAKVAHGKAKDILKTSALLSDVYFHYTPSQIMFASLLIADAELTKWYLSLKVPEQDQLQAILRNLEKCKAMLESVTMQVGESEVELTELKALNLRLKNLVALEKRRRDEIAAGIKREADAIDEKILKKRKLERDALAKEGDDLFGPALQKA